MHELLLNSVYFLQLLSSDKDDDDTMYDIMYDTMYDIMYDNMYDTMNDTIVLNHKAAKAFAPQNPKNWAHTFTCKVLKFD